MALQVCLLLELLLCAAVLTCTSALLALPRPYGSSRSLSHTLTEGAPPRSNTPVLRRVRRGWVWNQFFVLEEYTATEPVYVGKLYSDQDKGDGTVRYILTGEGAGTTFLIDEHTGDVRVTSRLDRERRAEYTLEAQAVDRVSGLPVEPASEFIIKVQDINDNEPRFPGTPFNATVTEMAEVGTPVLQVTAIDDDDPAYGNSAKLVYSILQGQPYFTIEPKTGLIRTALPGMDRETKETYLVVVEAKDMAGQRGGLTGTATVIISLSDINDNPPRFPQSTYQLSVSENAHPGSEVGRLRADDADLEGNAKVIYSTIGGDGQSTFEVITDTVTQEGIVKLRQVVDYERRQGYTLKVEAVNPTPSSRHTWPPGASRDVATVHVTVLDVDEPPVFSSEHRIFRVQEDQAVGSALGSVTARDPDAENSRVRYSIDQNTDLERMFDIGEHSGVLTLARALDHEQNVWHNISILGTQTNNEAMVGWTPVAIQVIDVNDNPPVLRPPLSMVVCENIRPGQVVQTIAAEDRDESSNPSEFRFFMGPDAKVRGNFTLRDNMNGTASLLARHGPYSRSGQPQFLLPVLVSDGGNRPLTSSATLTVQVCGCGNDGSVRRCGLEPAALAGVGTEALIALLACILILLVLVVLFVSLRRRKKEPLSAADDEEIRENIIAYDDEGGGEEDTEAFDIAALRTLQTPSRPNSVRRHDMRPELASAMPGTSLCSGRECPATVDIAGFIAGRVRQADDDPCVPPFDSVQVYAYEGCGSLAGSLSSIESFGGSDSDQGYDYLTEWGPRFQRLADLFGSAEQG
uniref:Cadherin 6 n=1 Tax=Eptatretus burgeri TaxID=7764 RepID=A0A8C4RB37_EPTBU